MVLSECGFTPQTLISVDYLFMIHFYMAIGPHNPKEPFHTDVNISLTCIGSLCLRPSNWRRDREYLPQ